MDWTADLQAGEEIRWEGRPAPRCYTFRNWRHSLFGMLLLVLALYWQIVGWQLGSVYRSVLVVLVPFPFLLIGLYLAVGHLLFARLEWERVFYALTDRRLLVRRGLLHRRLESLPLAEMHFFRFKPLGGELGTVRILCRNGGGLRLACLEHPQRLIRLLEARLTAQGDLAAPPD